MKFGLFIFCGWMAMAQAATEIKSIDFKWDGGASKLDIVADAPLTFTQEENAADHQIVLVIPNAKLGSFASRKLDASSFEGPVSLISPYMTPGKEDEVRVVIQLRGEAISSFENQGNSISASFSETGGGAKTTSKSTASSTKSEGDSSPASTENTQDPIGTFLSSRESKKFVGSKISLNVKDGDLTDIFRLIGETSGFNMVLSPKVTGKLTLALTDVPWDQALEITLQMMRLGAERNGNVLRILPLADLTQEKQDELAAKNAMEAVVPRITRIFPINYAETADLVKILESYVAASATRSGGAATGGGSSASIQVDSRTKSIVVYDIPSNIEKMGKLIALLDTQTPQIMIEGKVIEATEGFSKSLGGSLAIKSTNVITSSINGGNPNFRLVSSGFVDGSGSKGAGQFGFSPTMAFLPGTDFLNALITAGESENQVKVVSSPRSVVLNLQTATITQSTPVVIFETALVNGVLVTSPKTTDANVSLVVTPTVTNDENVMMKLNLTRGVPVPIGDKGSQVANRVITTQVVVENGKTLVLGGVYSYDINKTSSGFPFLRKIPVLGWFFGSESEVMSKVELIFFVTPKILNPGKQGFGVTAPTG